VAASILHHCKRSCCWPQLPTCTVCCWQLLLLLSHLEDLGAFVEQQLVWVALRTLGIVAALAAYHVAAEAQEAPAGSSNDGAVAGYRVGTAQLLLMIDSSHASWWYGCCHNASKGFESAGMLQASSMHTVTGCFDVDLLVADACGQALVASVWFCMSLPDSPKYEDHQEQYRQGKEHNVCANLQDQCAKSAPGICSAMLIVYIASHTLEAACAPSCCVAVAPATANAGRAAAPCVTLEQCGLCHCVTQ
jgi:hypothetical protein